MGAACGMARRIVGALVAVVAVTDAFQHGGWSPVGGRAAAQSRTKPTRGVSLTSQQQQQQRPLRRRDHRCGPRMAWGGDVVWSEVEVVSNDEAGTGLRALSIAVPAETAAGFSTPGQFVQMKAGDAKPGFYAVASPPSNASRVFEFLVKATDSNAWLTAAKPGSPLDMSGVAGKGFDVDKFEGLTQFDGFQCMNLIFLAQGTGIAPIRATIEHGVAIGLPKPATLYYGVRDDAHKAYADKFDQWRADFNVDVVEVQSKPLPGYAGLTGYVQDALKALGVAVPRNTGACLCGNKDFFMTNKDILLEAGLFEGRILSNF